MSRIGFYGGSFNPPTKAHIELAKKVIKECNLDKVIFVPVGDLYQKKGMAKGIHRYNMLEIASIRENDLQVSDIEIRETKNYKTIEIFEILKTIDVNTLTPIEAMQTLYDLKKKAQELE